MTTLRVEEWRREAEEDESRTLYKDGRSNGDPISGT